jgi:hypothetical protein
VTSYHCPITTRSASWIVWNLDTLLNHRWTLAPSAVAFNNRAMMRDSRSNLEQGREIKSCTHQCISNQRMKWKESVMCCPRLRWMIVAHGKRNHLRVGDQKPRQNGEGEISVPILPPQIISFNSSMARGVVSNPTALMSFYFVFIIIFLTLLLILKHTSIKR